MQCGVVRARARDVLIKIELLHEIDELIQLSSVHSILCTLRACPRRLGACIHCRFLAFRGAH